jgi:hypothetical protein
MQQKKKCFVIMPVSKTKSCTAREWTMIFKEMIKPAVAGSKLGFTCERSKPRTGNLIRDILNELNRADVVIADLTDMNPNVFYELGVRHTLRNRTILIAQDMKYVPSDLRSYWVITYKKGLSGLQDFKNGIKDTLKEMMNNPEKPDNPVADFLGEKNISLLSQEKSANLKKLTALVSELSYNLSSVDDILSTLKKSEEEEKQKKPYVFTNVRFSNVCLNELLSTRYIELPKERMKLLMSLNKSFLLSNANLELWRIEDFHSGVERSFKDNLPTYKNLITEVLKRLNQVRLDYMNNNYQEETTPVVLLGSEEHKQYIEST